VRRVLGQVRVDQDICEQPVLRIGVPVEAKAELMPDPAVGAVAADYVTSGDRLGVTAGGPDGSCNGVAARSQPDELSALLDHAAQLGEPGAQQPLGLVLWQIEQEPEPGTTKRKLQAGQALGLRVEAEVPHHLAALGEAISQAHHVEYFQGAGVYADRPALQRHPVAFVNDAGADATAEQLRG